MPTKPIDTQFILAVEALGRHIDKAGGEIAANLDNIIATLFGSNTETFKTPRAEIKLSRLIGFIQRSPK